MPTLIASFPASCSQIGWETDGGSAIMDWVLFKNIYSDIFYFYNLIKL